VKKCRTFEVEESDSGRPRKTWKEVVDKDMLDLGLKPGDGIDHSRRQRSRSIGVTVISGVTTAGCES